MAVAQAHRNISVSVPTDLADQLDAWTTEAGTSRSALVVRLIEEERRRRFEAELEQAYRELTEDGFFDDVEFYFPAGAEVILAEPYDSETG
jgi:hypothetical protein